MAREDAIAECTWAGDRFLRVRFGGPSGGPRATPDVIAAACDRVERAATPGLMDVTPARETLLLTFDMKALEAHGTEAVEARVQGALRGLALAGAERVERPPVEIPVCYGGEFGPDLAALAATHGLTPSEAAELHVSAAYTVEFVGFSPGFPYMIGLPARLATPRLGAPRARVAPGSVGIADDRTGIYPESTPGGWRLIGRTPLRLFDAVRDPPSLLRAGDRVRFTPISPGRFAELAGRGA